MGEEKQAQSRQVQLGSGSYNHRVRNPFSKTEVALILPLEPYLLIPL